MSLKRVIAGAGAAALACSLLVVPATTATAAVPASPFVSAAAAAVLKAEAGYPRQAQLQEYPDLPTDASINRGVIPFDEIAPRLNEWMKTSNRISVEVIGQSTQGRDLYLVTITAPESAAQTAQQTAWREKIRNDAAGAATDAALQAGYKVPIWFNNNIHGNEWDGTDASLNYIEDLLTAPLGEVNDLLRNNRIYFTLTNNPDGRVLNTRATALGLDPNRDFITNTTPETTAIRDIVTEIQPIYFSDIHGYTNVLQIEPCGPPHGENYDYDLFIPHAYASALRIEADVVAANIPGNTYSTPTGGTTTTNTGKLKIPYRDTPSGWDDWPPVFTAQYIAYHGAVAQTMELPLGRSTNITTNKANAVVNIEVAEVAIQSTIDYVTENRADMLANQIEIFRRGDAGEALRPIPVPADPTTIAGPDQWADQWTEKDQFTTSFPRAYVIPVGDGQRSATQTATLIDHLIDQNIEIDKANAAFTVGEVTYPAGSYIVDMHQPLRGMANSLLAAGSDISLRVTSMYDISAWSLGYLWGATVDRVGSTADAPVTTDVTPVVVADATGSFPTIPDSLKKDTYLSFDLVGIKEIKAVNALLAAGAPVASLPDGSVVLATETPESVAAVAAVADQFGIQVSLVDGTALLGDDVSYLQSLKVAYAGGADDLLSLTELGFTDLVAFNATSLTANPALLDDVDVLWTSGNIAFSGAQAAGSAALDAYLATGKGLVGRGSGSFTLAKGRGLIDAAVNAVAGNGSANGIVKIDNVDGGLLDAFGEDYAFVSAPVSFTGLAGTTTALQTYDAGNPVLSGHWRSTTATNGPEVAGGQASVITGTSAAGSEAILFGTYPNFRSHPKSMLVDIARSLFAVSLDGPEVVGPSVFADVSKNNAFFGDIAWLYEQGLTTGQVINDSLVFKRGALLTRQDLAAFLYRYAGDGWVPEVGTQTFSDIFPTSTFYIPVEWMAEVGLSVGTAQAVGKPKFKPGDSIIRQDFAIFLYRLAGSPAVTGSPSFPDWYAGAPWSDAVSWLGQTGISTGYADGTFRRTSTVDRQTTAAMLHRLDALMATTG